MSKSSSIILWTLAIVVYGSAIFGVTYYLKTNKTSNKKAIDLSDKSPISKVIDNNSDNQNTDPTATPQPTSFDNIPKTTPTSKPSTGPTMFIQTPTPTPTPIPSTIEASKEEVQELLKTDYYEESKLVVDGVEKEIILEDVNIKKILIPGKSYLVTLAGGSDVTIVLNEKTIAIGSLYIDNGGQIDYKNHTIDKSELSKIKVDERVTIGYYKENLIQNIINPLYQITILE